MCVCVCCIKDVSGKFHEKSTKIKLIFSTVFFSPPHTHTHTHVLVSLFNGISTFVGHLMPNHPCKTTVILLFNI